LTANSGGPTDAVWYTQSFDKYGNLWVNDSGHGTFGVGNFLMYRAAKYGVTGSPVPDIQITLQASPASTEVNGFAFDASGNLWFGCGAAIVGVQGVRMLTAAQLLSSNAAAVPTVIWSGSNFNMYVTGVTFDQAQNLWVADYFNSRIRKYSIVGAVSGNPAPLLTITAPGYMNGPDGLTFDPAGNLWVANDNDNRFLRFAAADLATSGAKIPTVVLQPGNIPFGNIVALPRDPQRSGPVSVHA
jgi:sugar lactone lactonase YvrE